MNYGRFFEYDFENSYLQEGITVFNYRWLQDKQDGERESPRYPIYVVFTPESISFNLHYYEKGEGEKEGKHYHNTIIKLDLSTNANVSGGIDESLNNTYYATFPMKTNDWLREKIYASFELSDTCVIGFYQMDTFNAETHSDYDNEIPKGNRKDTHFLRKLILDFLYDYEFTNVFKNVSFYDEIAAKIKDSFLLFALIKKLRYYYYRTVICADEVAGGSSENASAREMSLKFLFERYAIAENEWVDAIMDERAMNNFHESPWFCEAYQEMDQVYYTKRGSDWKRAKDKRLNMPQVSKVGKVFPIPKNDDEKAKAKERVSLHRMGVTKDNSFSLTVSNFLNLLPSRPAVRNKKSNYISDSFERAVRVHRDTAKNAAKWNVNHYHLWGIWKLWHGDRITFFYSLLLIAFSMIATIALYFQFNLESLGGLGFVLPAVSLIVFLLVMGYIMQKHFRSTWGMGIMIILMPKLLAAVVTAWFTMAMSEDLFHYFVREQFYYSAAILLTVVTCLFVFHEAYSMNPYANWRNYMFSTLVVFIIAYSYSLIVGDLVFDFFGKTIISKIDSISCICKSDKILPKDKWTFIFQFSFFASFIGIFLQLMFQGKSVTES